MTTNTTKTTPVNIKTLKYLRQILTENRADTISYPMTLADLDALTAALTRLSELEPIVQELVEALPMNRDWLDPVLERRAKASLAANRIAKIGGF